jgi:hypothetical protein
LANHTNKINKLLFLQFWISTESLTLAASRTQGNVSPLASILCLHRMMSYIQYWALFSRVKWLLQAILGLHGQTAWLHRLRPANISVW